MVGLRQRKGPDGRLPDPTHQLNVWIPEDLWRRIRIHGARTDTSMSRLVARLLTEGLDRLEGGEPT